MENMIVLKLGFRTNIDGFYFYEHEKVVDKKQKSRCFKRNTGYIKSIPNYFTGTGSNQTFNPF
jgi:hypothetical protein